MNWKRPQDELPTFGSESQILLRIEKRTDDEMRLLYKDGFYEHENQWFFLGTHTSKEYCPFIHVQTGHWMAGTGVVLTHWCEIEEPK